MILVIYVQDNTDADLKKHTQRYQRGDIVQALPDDHPFTPAEFASPRLRFVKLPFTLSEANAVISAEIDAAGVKNRKWRRIRFVDLTTPSFSSALDAFIADDKRTIPILELSAQDVSRVKNAVKLKPNADSL